MKNCKIFYETQIASHLKEIIQPLPQESQPDKSYYVSGINIFLRRYTEIYRIQTFAFEVLQECSFWASRNGAVQIFFLTSNSKKVARKFAM